MSWGDPMSKFYKDSQARIEDLTAKGIVPGGMVKLGRQEITTSHVYLWKEPGWESETFAVSAGLASIITVDCESDPTEDWIFLLISTVERQVFGWAPAGTLNVV